MSISIIINKYKKVKYHLKIKIHKLIVLKNYDQDEC